MALDPLADERLVRACQGRRSPTHNRPGPAALQQLSPFTREILRSSTQQSPAWSRPRRTTTGGARSHCPAWGWIAVNGPSGRELILIASVPAISSAPADVSPMESCDCASPTASLSSERPQAMIDPDTVDVDLQACLRIRQFSPRQFDTRLRS